MQLVSGAQHMDFSHVETLTGVPSRSGNRDGAAEKEPLYRNPAGMTEWHNWQEQAAADAQVDQASSALSEMRLTLGQLLKSDTAVEVMERLTESFIERNVSAERAKFALRKCVMAKNKLKANSWTVDVITSINNQDRLFGEFTCTII